jgi:hypothetical protein
MIRRGIGVQSFVSAGVSTDADAQAFITAAGITDATQQSAINTLVTDLKGYGIWTKMKAIYPFVGGTSSTHKWNLKDPRDLDAAFRLVFSGGITHSSSGVVGNAVNGYANTFLVPSTSLSLNSSHLSYYSRSNISELASEIGSNNLATNRLQITIDYSSVNYNAVNNGVSSFSYGGNKNGFFIASRTSSTQFKSYRNSTTLDTRTISSDGLNTYSISILAVNQAGTIDQYNRKQCAFASIGDGLTDTEAANLYTAVQAYQTTLSRNV